ncbi:MAG: hypothetical protein ACXVZX_01950 [Terriglobales bacterium]
MISRPVGKSRTRNVQSPASRDWWIAADILILLIYSWIVLFTVRFHEKWADEAQAWLLARDLDLRTLWLHELRYEGSPGLWHTLLWIAQRAFHAQYSALGTIGAACAIAGTAWLIFRSPFPRPIRYLMGFSYFFLYQYAVVGRSYVLFALFCFIAADKYRSRARPAVFALSLVPLALLTAHGSLVALGFAFAYAVRFFGEWKQQDSTAQRSFVYSAAALVLLYLFLFSILLPARDTEVPLNATRTVSVVTTVTLEGIAGALVDNRWLSVVILTLFAVWCYFRRNLLPFLLPVVFTLALYVYAFAWPHQQGTIFLVIVTGLAIAWPAAQERAAFSAGEKLAYRIVLVVLAAILGYQAYVAGVIIRNDIRLPYSGAEDAARFLQPVVAQHNVIYGYQYGMVAINAYYPHNIFGNWQHAYYHHGIGEFDPQKVGPEISAGHPDYVVTTWWDPFDPALMREKQVVPMASLGYKLVHVSDGYLLTKTGFTRRQLYFIFKKSEEIPE